MRHPLGDIVSALALGHAVETPRWRAFSVEVANDIFPSTQSILVKGAAAAAVGLWLK